MQDVLTMEYIGSSRENTQLFRWRNLLLEAVGKLGKDLRKAKRYKRWMEAAGFVDVTEMRFAWPINSWPRAKYHKILGVG